MKTVEGKYYKPCRIINFEDEVLWWDFIVWAPNEERNHWCACWNKFNEKKEIDLGDFVEGETLDSVLESFKGVHSKSPEIIKAFERDFMDE